MMKWLALAIAAGSAVWLSAGAEAQTIGIGTTSGGANAQVGAAIAGVVSSHAGLEMRPQKMGGTQRYVSMVNAGQLDFGVSNAMQYYMAATGIGLSKGQPHDKLRLAATLMKFVQGVIVAKNSGINTIADLRGKRIPTGYSSSPLFQTFWDAFLATANLTYKDVQPVLVASLPKSWDAFKQGQVDAVIAAAGSAAVREMDAVVPGGIKYIPISATPELLKQLPKTQIVDVAPSKDMIGIEKTTPLHVYEYVLFTGATTPDDTVYKVVKAIYENAKELKATSPLWRSYVPRDIDTNFGLEYHPGARRFFKEQKLSSE
jgi:TRAP transporter TAXI family solute receptor